MVSRPPDDRDASVRLALAAYQPFSAAQRGGVAYSPSPVLLLKVVERTNPACACSNHVFAIQCDQPRANHSRSRCDHACIGDSTVEREEPERGASDNPGRRVSRGLPVQHVCARCGEEASAALSRPHDKISSEDIVSTLELARPLDPWGLSVTGPGYDLSLAHCETPRAQAWSIDFLGQTTSQDGDRGRESVPERQY